MEWNAVLALITTCWVQFMFWSRGHGAILDEGRNKNPDISRYDRWFKVPLDFVWDKLLELKNNNKFFGRLLKIGLEKSTDTAMICGGLVVDIRFQWSL